ncbi:MAG: tetratricopeptide repeat protein [bacterium]|nr:tetratricopeptide repeat protein [bacterium]
MARVTRKQLLKEDEFVETTKDFSQWFEENWKNVVKWAGVAAAVVVVVALFFVYQASQQAKARVMLGDGIAKFNEAEQGGFSDTAAIEASWELFDQAAGKAGGSAAGSSARYYRANAAFRLGKQDEAISGLEEVVGASSTPPALRGTARATLASVHADSGEPDKAIEQLQILIDDGESGFPPQVALLQLGRLQAAQGDTESARAAWQRILDEFKATSSANTARELLEQ